MKKIFMILVVLLLLSGCGKTNNKDLVKDLTSKVNNSNSYHMMATLEIYRNEEKYSYNVDSLYLKDDYFKVDLVNQNNNHEQIILKNEDGVYVLTPSLNKSFKFQSDWPYNNSQIYLLQPIVSDLSNDQQIKIEKTSEGYTLTSMVNYSTEKDFKKQKVYLDTNINITKVEILDEKENVRMSLKISNLEYNSDIKKEEFDVAKYQKQIPQDNSSSDDKDSSTDQNQENNNSASKLEDVVYPMYVPVDTYLTGKDIVNTSTGERAILTFAGESAFTIVQETSENTISTNYIYGDPYLILDTVGAITDYSVTWISNGVEYSVMSDTMDLDELLTVAQSISVKAVGK